MAGTETASRVSELLLLLFCLSSVLAVQDRGGQQHRTGVGVNEQPRVELIDLIARVSDDERPAVQQLIGGGLNVQPRILTDLIARGSDAERPAVGVLSSVSQGGKTPPIVRPGRPSFTNRQVQRQQPLPPRRRIIVGSHQHPQPHIPSFGTRQPQSNSASNLHLTRRHQLPSRQPFPGSNPFIRTHQPFIRRPSPNYDVLPPSLPTYYNYFT